MIEKLKENVRNDFSAILDEMIRERRNGNYKSFYDFCKRMHGKDFNRRAIESLIKCGALDNLDANRRQMLSVMKTVLDDLDYDRRKNAGGQMSFFDISSVQFLLFSSNSLYASVFP